MSLFFRIYQHLLPRAKAWRMVIDKTLRNFFEGLTGLPSDTRDFVDGVWEDMFPQTTRELVAWEQQFHLPNNAQTEQVRRDRLEAAWKALGGQSPGYIQGILQAAGFDVYIHEWWEPGSNPPIARNPNFYLFGVPHMCGDTDAECGEPDMECGLATDAVGYHLVNKLLFAEYDYIYRCGEPFAECGEPGMECGENNGVIFTQKPYPVPQYVDEVLRAQPEISNGSQYWPNFLYFGGQTFGTTAQVPLSRKDEFEDLCLKICPTQDWLVLLIEYTDSGNNWAQGDNWAEGHNWAQ